MNVSRLGFVLSLCVFAAVSRLLPHPDNFTPVAAVALFGAATISSRWLAAIVPLAALLASDAVFQATYRAGWQTTTPGFYAGQWVVYACVLATVGIGTLVRRSRNVRTIAAGTLASSLLFYLVTNFAVFCVPGSGYPRSLAGLLLCYEAGLPFFGRGLAGDVTYTTILFGALALAEVRFPSLRPAKPSETLAPALAA